MGKECFKCGTEMRPHYSAYQPWDEEIRVLWIPASNDDEHVEETDSGGKHPNTASRRFCSRDCLDAFMQADSPFPPENEEGDDG